MPDFVCRANIDHYLELLNDPDLSTGKRATVVKLLIGEADKLSYYQDQLNFAESRAASGREWLAQLRCLCDAEDPIDRAQTDRVIAAFETKQRLMDDFCHKLRTKVMNSGL
jgi:hypothetical protein